MKHIPVLIVTRLTSERLPRKPFMDIGGMSMIEHIIKRCEFYDFRPYLCVPESEGNEFAGETSCLDIFEGSPDNVRDRVLAAAKYWKISEFHQLDGDDPYFNPFLIKFGQVHQPNCLAPMESEGGAGLCGTWYHLEDDREPTRAFYKTDSPWFQRLTVDYPEDLEMMRALHRMGCDYMTPRSIVDDFFRRNPDLHKINWYRTAEWKKRQNDEKYRR